MTSRCRFDRLLGPLLLLVLALSAWPPAVAQRGAAIEKIDPRLLEQFATEGTAGFFVRFAEQADLSPAYRMGWEERGPFVVEALQTVAERSQAQAIAYLDRQGIEHETRIAGNDLYVPSATLEVALALAARPEVSSVRAVRLHYLDPLIRGERPVAPQATIAWGLLDTQADRFWAIFGAQGQGIVVANIDTGVQWNHPALGRSFRCPDHPDDPTCWADPSNICGPQGACDNVGHGTHTMGTMVGDDDISLPYIVGMAPQARWIACKGCESDFCSDVALTACADWILHPGGRAANRPHVVNNSWGSSGGDGWYQPYVAAWRAAGIFPAFSAGNKGPGCGTLGSPGDYQESFDSAAHDANRNAAYFSSRGPSAFGHDPYTKPNISAPGVGVCSSVPIDGWSCGYSGTSMASPHSAGAVALLWSCNPALIGQVDQTFQALQSGADLPPAGNCGAPPDGRGNYTYGSGYLNVYQAGLQWCGQSGRLNGHVYDAHSALPIAGATVTAQGRATFGDITDAGGAYSMTVLVGTYTLTASAYGYLSGLVNGVVVVTDTSTTQELSLLPAPRHTISGTVTEAGTGIPLDAVVLLVDTPLPPAHTDPATGLYSITVAAGTYTFHVTSADHSPVKRRVVIDGDQVQDFELPRLPCILLVDDDRDIPDVRPYYSSVLDNLGFSYGLWDTKAEGTPPSADDLLGHRIVIWFTGYPYVDVFTAADEQAVAAYLDAGGNFFLSSEDYLYDAGLTPFGRDYLGIDSYEDDVLENDVIGKAGHPIGAGLGPYTLTPPVDWNAPLWTDYVSGPQSPFQFQASGKDNSTNQDGGSYRTVFLGWPLEGVADPADRQAVMAAIIAYLGGCSSTGTLSGRVIHAYYGTPIAEASLMAQAEGNTAETTTDPDGYYAIALPPGDYVVTATKAGYDVEVFPDVVVAPGINVLDIELGGPVALVTPAGLFPCLVPGGAITLPLTIQNPGRMDLVYRISETTATLPLSDPAGRSPPAGRNLVCQDVPWMSVSPVTGTVPAGSGQSVDVTFFALPPYDAPGKTYQATLIVEHNDPFLAGAVLVQVGMTVGDTDHRPVYLPVVYK